MKQNIGILLILCLIVGTCVPGCGKPRIQSLWVDKEVVVDGIDNEWQDCLLFYDEKTRTMLGVYNNEKMLYVRVATRDRELQKKAMAAGMTLWFDPEGGAKEVLGIQYPLDMANGRRGDPPSRMDMDSSQSRPKKTLPDEMKILGPEEGQVRHLNLHDAERLEGVQVRIDNHNGLYVCELGLSLEHLNQQEEGGPIGLGVVIGSAKLQSSPGGRSGSPMGGGGMGRPGGGKGRRGPGGPSAKAMSPTELWVKVWLASPNTLTEPKPLSFQEREYSRSLKNIFP